MTETPAAHTPAPPAEPVGFDRALLLSLAQVPAIAVLWVLAAWAASAAVEQFGWHLYRGPHAINLGPVAVICAGMLLAAFIDGYAFKVPNWCTLSLVVSGWYVGLLHDFGVTAVPGLTPALTGGLVAALGGTAVGFFLLFPALFIRGMGEGDVKMTMGFGSWLGACFGLKVGVIVLAWAFAVGVLIGGVFGVVVILMRARVKESLEHTKQIGTDLKVMATEGYSPAADRANARRKDWVRLPYGVPLCAGFLGYLWYFFFLG